MQYTSLGNTGLKVSVAGIGCGGHSRIGLSSGKSAVESAAIIRQAVDLGVNFIDTAAAYGTEAIVGRAISEVKREEVVISSKARVCDLDGALHPVEEVVASLDQSLANLGIDCIDVFHLHGVPPRHYDYATEMVVPALLRERDKGKFSYLGITEIPPHDPDHDMLLQMQSGDGDLFGVIMVAYHMLNQSAKDLVFPMRSSRGSASSSCSPCEFCSASRAVWRGKSTDSSMPGSCPRHCAERILSGFSSTTAARTASSTPPIAIVGTRPEPMSSSLAPAAPIICGRMSIPSSVRRCRPRMSNSSRHCSPVCQA